MGDIALRLSEVEELHIAEELSRLFKLQGKPLLPDDKVCFVGELSRTGYPFKAIESGIKSLFDQDLKTIKLSLLKDAIRPFISDQEEESLDCGLCKNTGFVHMADEKGYVFSVPCQCSRGVKFARAQKLPRWNGKRQMISRGRKLHLVWPDPSTVQDMDVHADEEIEQICEFVHGEVVTA